MSDRCRHCLLRIEVDKLKEEFKDGWPTSALDAISSMAINLAIEDCRGQNNLKLLAYGMGLMAPQINPLELKASACENPYVKTEYFAEDLSTITNAQPINLANGNH